MVPVSKSISHINPTGTDHELQTRCVTRTGHHSVSIFHRQRTGSTRLRPGRLAECLGPMPLCRSRYCSISPGRVHRARGSRFELCLPAWILAWPMGALPRHAVPRSLAKRDVSVTRQCPSRTECAFCRRIRITLMSFNVNGGFLPASLPSLQGSPVRKPEAYNRAYTDVHLYWVNHH